MKFKLHVVQAEEGDCLLLEYGKSATRFILIDGGPAGIYHEHLAPALADLGVKRLDAVLLTHVDTDHARGLREFFAALQNEDPPSVQIDDLWMNAFDDVIDKDGAIKRDLAALVSKLQGAGMASAGSSFALAGVADGNDLRSRAVDLGIKRNQAWNAEPILFDDEVLSLDLDPLNLTVVGPTRASLDELRDAWREWIDKQRKHFNDNKPGLAAMADKSVPNLSSVQLHAKLGGRTLLLTGDGRGDHLLDGLEAAGLLEDDGAIDVDVLKLPHHGSDRNVTRAFFERVRAKVYVASANGKDGNPDLPTLVWIVESAKAQGRAIELVLTNQTPSVKALRASHPPADWGYSLRTLPQNDHALVVDLLAL